MRNFSRTTQSAEKLDASAQESTLAHIRKIKEEMAVSNLRLRDMQGELPAQSNGFYLNLILGEWHRGNWKFEEFPL